MMDLNDNALPDLSWMPMPALLVDADRTLVSYNHELEKIFPSPRVGTDISLLIRDPEFLSCLAQVIQNGRKARTRISVKGNAERVFSVWMQPMAGGRGIYIVHLYETTRAYEAEKMRSTFVADVSHELRSPLTTMIATLETLKGRAGEDPDTRARFVDLTASEAGRMHRIVNDLLALSATEARKHITPSEKIFLRPILENIVKTLGERLLQKNMKVALRLEDDLPAIVGDRDEMTQVFQNLLDNAINYGDEGGTITISHVRDAVLGEQSVSVNNHGSVIKAEHIPRLTERFYRADSSRSRHMGGTGLGLAIVKHILGRHSGQLYIESNESDGTTFTVSVPE